MIPGTKVVGILRKTGTIVSATVGGWIDENLADGGLGCDATAADSAGVDDAAETGDPGVLLRAVAFLGVSWQLVWKSSSWSLWSSI